MPSIPRAEVSAAVSTAFKIPGLYRRGEAAFLYRLARRKGTLVEIGCWQGRTTSLLVQAARVWGAEIVTIDPFSVMPAPHKQSSPELWRSNLKKLGLEAPHLYHMLSTDAARAYYHEAPAFVFIDGDHRHEAVLRDLRDWTPRLPVGGVVALHDMFYPTISGVATAVTEWWIGGGMGRWQFVGLIDFTIAFRRLV